MNADGGNNTLPYLSTNNLTPVKYVQYLMISLVNVVSIYDISDN